MRGANVSGEAKQPPWFGFQGPKDFARMRSDWGMNAMRFLVEWAALEPEKGQYDSGYLDEVAKRIEWARDANLLVVLDMHEDVYGEGFASGGGDGAPLWTCAASNYASFKPENPWALENLEPSVIACDAGFWHGAELQAHFAEGWRRVAARLVGYENVVGFDLYNEPFYWETNLQDFEPDLLGPFYEKVVPIVRSAAPDWVAFVEPGSLRNLGGTTHLKPPSFSNFAYAPHSYDTDAEQGMGFDPSHAPAIISNIKSLAGEAKALGGALWIGEYGGTATEPGIVPYMTATYKGAGAVAASSMYWDYSKGGYGLLAADGSEAQPLLDTVIRPYPERVAGDPIDWSFDDSTSTFTLRYHPKATVTAPTIVSIAPRIYPRGYSFECGGCKAIAATGSLTVTTPPPTDPVVVKVHP
jgi:endoglycosylceramidase